MKLEIQFKSYTTHISIKNNMLVYQIPSHYAQSEFRKFKDTFKKEIAYFKSQNSALLDKTKAEDFIKAKLEDCIKLEDLLPRTVSNFVPRTFYLYHT